MLLGDHYIDGTILCLLFSGERPPFSQSWFCIRFPTQNNVPLCKCFTTVANIQRRELGSTWFQCTDVSC
jgi:hypothetical protein